MRILTWMYVSRSLLVPDHRLNVLDDIVATARRRNQELDVTGCLIFARDRFAQILEGPVDSLEQLRKDIKADERHMDVITLDVPSTEKRRFTGWSLAYVGPSFFVERTIIEAIKMATLHDRHSIKDLIQMMEHFVSPTASITEPT